ncbi:MAG: hypothetical protein QNI84_05705 [Henriciella sp.]|nr:hypothetical protein [Henriciella sp.]
MQWLLTHIWASLLVAGFLGLLAGFGARGFFVSNRVRRAEVDRDVAQTELQQTRAEVDDLYAAQRKQKDAYAAEQGTREHDLLQELSSRDTTINNLSNALKEARDELKRFAEEQEQKSSGLAETAGAALAGAAAATAASMVTQPDEASETKITELTERNAWLESRVARLEADLSEQAASDVVSVADTPAPEPVAEPAAETTATGEDLQREKLQWQNSYLRQRVEALETALVVQESSPVEAPAEPEPKSEPDGPTLVAVPTSAAPEDTASPSETDEELARLRWRNRYLEGRLAYYEEGQVASALAEDAEAESAEPVEEETSAEPEDIETVEPVLVTETEDTSESETDEADTDTTLRIAPIGAETEADPEPETTAEAETEPADDTEADEAEAVEAGTEEAVAEDAGPDEAEAANADEASDEGETEPETVSEAPPVDPVVETEVEQVEEAEPEPVEAAEMAEEVEESSSEADAPTTDDAGASAAAPIEEHPSEAVLQELGAADLDEDTSKVQPFAIDRPADGGDDLTAIGGIGPRISTVLNELGIWTYAQIADWTTENQHWIDDHLAFNGRVARENWVEQAGTLATTPQEVDA